MRVLLIHGADGEAEDKKGRTSFQIASVKGYNDIVRLLSDLACGEGVLGHLGEHFLVCRFFFLTYGYS